MAKAAMNNLLKRRMTASQQASELRTGDEAYEKLFREAPPPGEVQIRSLPLDKLVPFSTADIGFRPYTPTQLEAFAEQLKEEGLLVRIIVRPTAPQGSYERAVAARPPLLPEVPGVRASLPMRHECNGKIAAFLFQAGNAPGDNLPFVRYKAVIPAAFDHKDGRGINGHILSGNRLDPVDFLPAPPANAHSERPRSSVAACASHHAGLFRHASFQASVAIFDGAPRAILLLESPIPRGFYYGQFPEECCQRLRAFCDPFILCHGLNLPSQPWPPSGPTA